MKLEPKTFNINWGVPPPKQFIYPDTIAVRVQMHGDKVAPRREERYEFRWPTPDHGMPAYPHHEAGECWVAGDKHTGQWIKGRVVEVIGPVVYDERLEWAYYIAVGDRVTVRSDSLIHKLTN